MEPMEYNVMRIDHGTTLWLADDEKTWTPRFYGAAAFTSAKLADDIAKRELGADATFYVMGCMPTISSDEEG